jgi:hypothetical protein
MSVLSRRTIEARLKIPGWKPESLVITPFLGSKRAFDHDAIDLRLGSFFLIPQRPPAPFLDPEPRSL